MSMASRVSTRTVQIAHNVLVRAIRQAERDDLVGRNVAALVKPPRGRVCQITVPPNWTAILLLGLLPMLGPNWSFCSAIGWHG